MSKSIWSVSNIPFCHLCFIIYHHAKFSKKSSVWILRTRCLRFLAQFRIKMSHFGTKKYFLKILNIITLLTYNPPLLCKISKKIYRVDSRKKVQKGFEPYLRSKLSVLGKIVFLKNIHSCHLSLLIVSYHLIDFKNML